MSLFVAGFLFAQQSGKGLLDQGRAKKTAGDLQAAMEAFEAVVANFGGADRNAAANALLELGAIADSLGQLNRARGYYDRVRNDFKDQTAEVEIAANRLRAQAAPRGATSAPGGAPSPSRVTIQTPYADDIYGFALSPDGKTLVFQVTTPDGKRQLWRQAVDPAAKPEPIAGSDGAGINARPFFSPDGKSVVFFANQKLWQLDLAGGVPKELLATPTYYGGAWNGDSILLAIRGLNSPLDLLQGGRASVAPMTVGNYASPQFLDDRRFIYFARDPRGQGTIAAGSLDGPVTARGIPAAHAGTYTKGFLVYATSMGVLNALRFDPKELVSSGAPIVLANRVGIERRLVGVAAVNASVGGSIAYRENAILNRQMLWMDRNGALLGMVGAADAASPSLPRVSPDGRSVVFFRQLGAALGSIWAIDAETGALRQARDGANVAIWSPAGDRLAVAALRAGGGVPIGPMLQELPIAAIGAGGAQFGPSTGVVMPQDWAANGNILYLTGVSAIGNGSGDLFVLLPNRADSVPVAQTAASERNGRFSPDGNWIAYQSDESGRNEIYVQPFPGALTQRQRVSLNGGVSPQWGRKGGELYFISGDNHLTVATVSGAEKGSIEFNTPKPLFKSALPQGAEYDTALDGDRFLVLAPVGDPSPIVVLQNWAPEQ
jgi:Tol biopolymer transport system component